VVKALPYTDSHEICPPCAYVRWLQVVAELDAGGRRSVIRLLPKRKPFIEHVCMSGVPRTAARAPLYCAIVKNDTLGYTALSGAAIHQMHRRAGHADYDPAALAKLGGHSLRAGFVTQSTVHRDGQTKRNSCPLTVRLCVSQNETEGHSLGRIEERVWIGL
jgi:hypothetical protein